MHTIIHNLKFIFIHDIITKWFNYIGSLSNTAHKQDLINAFAVWQYQTRVFMYKRVRGHWKEEDAAHTRGRAGKHAQI